MKFFVLIVDFIFVCFLICSVFKEHHVIIAANDTIPTAINTTEQIGDEVALHYRVRNKTACYRYWLQLFNFFFFFT